MKCMDAIRIGLKRRVEQRRAVIGLGVVDCYMGDAVFSLDAFTWLGDGNIQGRSPLGRRLDRYHTLDAEGTRTKHRCHN